MNVLGEKSPLNLKQSSIVVVLSFILLSLFGSLPYMYVNPFYDGIDTFSLFASSFLESTSGFTTTGISTILNPENLSDSFSFYRSYTLWVGGLSFVYFVVALYYPETKLAGIRHLLGGGILRFKQLLATISIIFAIYTAIIAILIIFLGNVNILDSVSLSFATLSSGGFVPISTILNSVNSITLVIIMSGMIIAALPFAFHFGIFSKEIEATKEIKEIVIFMVVMATSIFLFIFIESSFSEKEWIPAVFHVISASTTTGFQFIDLSQISVTSKMLLIILMLIGGTAFSTAGGIKIARLVLIFQKLNKHKSRYSYKNHYNNQPSVISATAIQFRKSNNQDKKIMSIPQIDTNKFYIYSDKAFREALFVITLFILFTIVTAICIYYINQNSNSDSKVNFIDIVFETSSTISNTGLSAGLTAIDLDSISKLILSFNMIMGRFEIIAILYIFISKLRR
jgi:trk system potassium uptake protein TrkH